MEFVNFSDAVARQFERMQEYQLFKTDIKGDVLWKHYLDSFPEGSNPIHKERTEHDCQNCKQFIRNAGNIIAIIDGKIVSIWDIRLEGTLHPYQVVADAMAKKVKSKAINTVFLTTEGRIGTNVTYAIDAMKGIDKQEPIAWNHFSIKIPKKHQCANSTIGEKLNATNTLVQVFKRALSELTIDSVETVIDLIEQGSLYRGDEYKHMLVLFGDAKRIFEEEPTKKKKDLFCWSIFDSLPANVLSIRNTVIGSLLVDLSEDADLTYAVRAFENKVAPTNYKRPTSLITRTMISKAEKLVDELGYTSALDRRYAVTEDITINNVLFADREARKAMSVFDDLPTKSETVKAYDSIAEVSILNFIETILPKAETIELFVENSHVQNFVSLIAPKDSNSKNMLKWDNNFSWAYQGDVTDSIKQRVKAAGGNVEGDFRASLSWFNGDDLDLHLTEPGGFHIYFRNKKSPNNGKLDVDMNAGGKTNSIDPVENITYADKSSMKHGTYKLVVNNYNKRSSTNVGFDVELEFDGKITKFSHPNAMANGANVTVATFKYSSSGIEFIEKIASEETPKEIWNINTQKFQKVSMIMNSPNHWDGNGVGNKHYMFMLDKCVNNQAARGFFNEFLTDELKDHRKVFEVLGSKLKTKPSDNQLSGLGFSSTQRNSVLCKVSGSFSRTIKLIF